MALLADTSFSAQSDVLHTNISTTRRWAKCRQPPTPHASMEEGARYVKEKENKHGPPL